MMRFPAIRERTAGLGSGSWRCAASSRVDLLDLVGHARPRELLARGRAGLHEAPAQRLVAHRAFELLREHVDVAGLEEQPEVAVAQDLLVDRHPAGQRYRARAQRPHEHARRGHLPQRGGDHDVRRVDRVVLVVDDRHAVAQGGAQRRHRARLGVDHGLPRQILGEPAQRAQEQPQRGALLAVAEADPHRSGDRHALLRGHPRPQQPVGGGEIALQQVLGGLVAGRPRVHPPEEELDELARHLRREHPLDRGMERPDVQRAAVAQGHAARARRPRLVYVHEIQRRDAQRLLDRPRDVDRRGRIDRLARGVEEQLADPEHPHAPVGVEERLGRLPRGPDQAPRLAYELGRARRRQQHHAVPTLGQLTRDLVGERPDLVGILEGMRRDLGDGEPFCHCRGA